MPYKAFLILFKDIRIVNKLSYVDYAPPVNKCDYAGS
jgi:hypothetical protein